MDAWDDGDARDTGATDRGARRSVGGTFRRARRRIVAAGAAVALAVGGALALPLLTAGSADAATRVVLPLKAETFYTSSMYGPRCLPVANASAWHLGIDLEAQNGAPIYAVAAGTVTHVVNPKGSDAGYIVIRHSINGVRYDSVSVHMQQATRYVHVGQKVSAGQRIALVGSSGPATSPNLHLEVWKGGWQVTSVNPMTFLSAHGVSIAKARIFDQHVVTPKTCTYYSTASRLNVRSGPGTSHKVLRTVPRNTRMVSAPGKKTSGFVPVTIGSTKGWVSAAYVSPTKVGSSGTTRVTYVVVHDTWMRTGPSTAYAHVRAVRKGTRITVVYASIRGSKDVSVGGTRGFVLDSRLRRA